MAPADYYKPENEIDGDWFAFFNKELDTRSEYNSPHFVLFMAFLDIFKASFLSFGQRKVPFESNRFCKRKNPFLSQNI